MRPSDASQTTLLLPPAGTSVDVLGQDVQPSNIKPELKRKAEQPRSPVANAWLPVLAGTGVVPAQPMIDYGSLYQQQQWRRLRKQLQRDGYLLLKGVLPPEQVAEAYEFLLRQLHRSKPDCFDTDSNSNDVLAAGAVGIGLLQRQDLAAAPQVRRVLEAEELFTLVANLLQEADVATSSYKWLRAVGQGEFTGLHTDRVFLGRGSQRLLTLWLPLGPVPLERGPLLVARASHRTKAFQPLRDGYGASEVGKDGTRSGWLSDDGSTLAGVVGQEAVDWRVALDCQAGDVVVLGMDVLHMSACNQSDRVRISCDTRWQPRDDAKDPRVRIWRGRTQQVVSG